MTYTTLISAKELQSLMARDVPLMVFDCSFDLTQPAWGADQYAQGHIPGAVYAHLDQHLSAPKGDAAGTDTPASGGRHPLPSRERFAAWLARVGFGRHMQAVVYDRNGLNYCGRLWWMLQWVGHGAVAVLDGGWQAWQAAGGPTAQGNEAPRAPQGFACAQPLVRLVTADQVLQGLGQPAVQTVLDARGAPRYRGEVEPMDPVAGHIPGALNRPFTDNIDAATGRMKTPEVLRAELDVLLAGRDPATVVHQCGSGVSAVPNLLAMRVAGYGPTALFAGSWSEWCSDAQRPVERG